MPLFVIALKFTKILCKTEKEMSTIIGLKWIDIILDITKHKHNILNQEVYCYRWDSTKIIL